MAYDCFLLQFCSSRKTASNIFQYTGRFKVKRNVHKRLFYVKVTLKVLKDKAHRKMQKRKPNYACQCRRKLKTFPESTWISIFLGKPWTAGYSWHKQNRLGC